MQNLRSTCPPDCKSQLDALIAKVPTQHQSGFASVLNAGLSFGIPWPALINWALANYAAILAMVSTGQVDWSAVIAMLSSLWAIFKPAA